MTNPDYRVKISVSNARILRRIEALGYKQVAQFCRDYNLTPQQVSGTITNRIRPVVRKTGEWTELVMDLSAALHCAPE